MKTLIRCVAVSAMTACLALAQNATAEENSSAPYPFAASLLPSYQYPADESADVLGLRLGVVSSHRNVSMLDLNLLAGFAGGTESGLQLSGVYNSIGSANGLFQLGVFANKCEGDFVGAQLSALYNNCGGNCYGMSVGLMDIAKNLNGLQIGLVNRVKTLEGLQIGLVNFSEESEGIQIGLVNVMLDGFYPVFPLFNFGIWK